MNEQEYIDECWKFMEQPKPGSRIAPKARSLQDLVHEIMKANGQHVFLLEQTVIQKWPEIVGAMVAEHCQAYDVKEGELRIRVDNPIWKTELIFRRSQIVQSCNQLVGQGVIKTIKVY